MSYRSEGILHPAPGQVLGHRLDEHSANTLAGELTEQMRGHEQHRVRVLHGSGLTRSLAFDYAKPGQMISSSDNRYATLVPDDDPPGLVALTRLQVLNTMLLAAAVEGRDIAHIPYEAAVRSRQTALAELVRVVPELAGQFGVALGVTPTPTSPPQAGVPDQEYGIYSTATGKEELVAYLSEAEAGAVKEATAAAVTAAASVMSAAAAGRAAAWLGGGQHYRLAPANGVAPQPDEACR